MPIKRWPVSFAMIAVAALIGIAVQTSPRDRTITIRGATMGTTYSVKARIEGALDSGGLQDAIDARLREINRTMSTWDKQSELSKVNASRANIPIPISTELRLVLAAAQHWSRETDGALDVTVGPLVNLWGYGPESAGSTPTPEQIIAARKRTGYRHLRLGERWVSKGATNMAIDLSAIAKGYGVDEIGNLLRQRGVSNFVVEIGGEVLTSGTRDGESYWMVGIENPASGRSPGKDITALIPLRAGAMATSGSYRRFRNDSAGRSHHIIDPRTGSPSQSRLIAVTVFAADCMTADALATALMVMGVDDGMRWVASHEGIDALFVFDDNAGGFQQRGSAGVALNRLQ